MKNKITTLIFSATTLFSTTVNINPGWNLVGAMGAIVPSQISCAKTVWSYENKAWKLYTIQNSDANNYGFAQLSNIEPGKGFWVNSGTDSCNIDFSNLTYIPTEGKTFLSNGLVFTEKKNSVKYTIPGNTASYDDSNKTFTLTAVKNTVSDSRSGIVIETPQPLSLVEATLNLQTANTTSSANRAQLNTGNIPLVQFDANTTRGFSSGVTLSSRGIYAWASIDFVDGTWEDIYSQDIALDTSLVGKDIKVKVFIEGSKIKYEFSGGYVGTHTIDTSELSYNNTITAEINGGIRYAELRSRVKVASDATDTSVVTVSDVKVAPYIKEVNATATTTESFSNLENFMMLDNGNDKPSYINFTKGTTNFSSNEYLFNGTSWQADGNFSGTVNNNDVSIADSGEGINLEIYHTQKVAGYSNLYMHFVKSTVTTAPNNYEYDTWNWSNPSYYNPTTQQQVPITNLDSLIAGFTTRDNQGGGVHFGDNESPMFLDQNASLLPTRGGNVVLGKWTGGYYDGCTDSDCKVFMRTDNIVGTWSEDVDNNRINVETPQSYLTFKVKQVDSDYKIAEGDKDKEGAVWYDVILSGADATDTNIRAILTQNP